ncbi:MAG TPA: hypothetical protein VKM55_19065 [Candidatus Lokiarchaeia archaeon]|nr:hypothetical protein [Candidatus Lokiarchaeia archaeon]
MKLGTISQARAIKMLSTKLRSLPILLVLLLLAMTISSIWFVIILKGMI